MNPECYPECDICMNCEFNVQLDCNHVFCKECIDCWFDISKSKTCPICRQTTISVTPLIVENQKKKQEIKQEIKTKLQAKMHELRQTYKNSKSQKPQKTSITLYFGKDAEFHGWKMQFQYEVQKLVEYITKKKSTYRAPSNWMDLFVAQIRQDQSRKKYIIFPDLYELQNIKYYQFKKDKYFEKRLQYIDWLQKKTQRALR
jgi:hypothetical protein